MKIQNATPYVPFAFEALDHDGERAQVVVVKGTFDIVPGQPLSLAAEQEPVWLSDEYEPPAEGPAPGPRPAASSLVHEDDLAPFKPRTDIHLRATAHSPSGKPEREWLAGVEVGKVKKRVRVTGPRVFARAPGAGFALGPPEPALSVPITYDRAFGGEAWSGDAVEVCQENPAGRGFGRPRAAEAFATAPAPVILPPDGADPVLGRRMPVEGFGPMAKSWLPRRRLAGTFDQRWLDERYPKVPDDFDDAFYNSAHPDLQYPGHLRGDEPARLERLTRDREIVTFTLPRRIVAAALVDARGFRYGALCRLDTLFIDTERMQAYLVWRARLPILKHGVRRVDVGERAMFPERAGVAA